MDIRALSADDVRQALPMAVAIEAMKESFSQLSSGQTTVPLRSRIDVTWNEGITLFMPALLHTTQDLAVKIVSVFPRNQERGMATIHALVVALEAETGRPLAVMEGASLTAIRTGAASGAATDFLALPEAKTLAIFGSGAQARTQLEAVCTVRSIEQVWVYSLDEPGVQTFAEEMAGLGPIPAPIHIVDNPREAVAGADVICTATTSSTPVFDGHDLKPGAHINAIGSFTPTMQEIDAETVQKARVIVDFREAVLAESGDLMIPIEQGLISADWIYAELGEIATGRKSGRTDASEITLFKSVGIAVQDAMAASRALAGALKAGLGQTIKL
jgi:alanine dehydrogenase